MLRHVLSLGDHCANITYPGSSSCRDEQVAESDVVEVTADASLQVHLVGRVAVEHVSRKHRPGQEAAGDGVRVCRRQRGDDLLEDDMATILLSDRSSTRHPSLRVIL